MKTEQELLKIIADAQAELEGLRKKPTAKEYVLNFLNENDGKFEVQIKEGFIIYYRNGQRLFLQDLKNKVLWCYYHSIWKELSLNYGMSDSGIQKLIKETVGATFNCKECTPYGRHLRKSIAGGGNIQL